MSMIYECPNCHTPQAAGRTACRYCGAEFDSPVPDDAFLPDGTPAEPAPPASDAPILEEPVAQVAEATGAGVYEAPAAEAPEPEPAAEPEPVVVTPAVQEAAPEEAEPRVPVLDAVAPPPAPAETLPYQSPPYLAPAYQSAPTYAGLDEAADREADKEAPAPLGQTLTRALLIAAPIVLILVLGAVFFARSLESGSDTAPTPLAVPVSAPADTSTSSGAPAAPPYVLGGAGASAGADADPRARRMVGRWESKKLDFYVFNENMSGTRGSVTGSGSQGTFLWTLAQNHLILYADKQEKLTYTQGPDQDTMFLRAEGGKYVQYERTKT